MWGAQQFWGPKPGTQTGSRFTDDYRNMFQPLPAFPPIGVTTGPPGFASGGPWSQPVPVPMPLPAYPPAGPWPMLPNPDSGEGGGSGDGGGGDTGGGGGDGGGGDTGGGGDGGGGDIGGDPGGDPGGEGGGDPGGEGEGGEGEGGEGEGGDEGGEGDGGDHGGKGGGGNGNADEETIRKYNEAMQAISEGRALEVEYDENGNLDREASVRKGNNGRMPKKEEDMTWWDNTKEWITRDITVDYGEPDDPADALWDSMLGNMGLGKYVNDALDLVMDDPRGGINNWMAKNHELAGIAAGVGAAAVALSVATAIAWGITGGFAAISGIIARGAAAAARGISATAVQVARNAAVLTRLSGHALQSMLRRGISITSVERALRLGNKFHDKLHDNTHYVLREGDKYIRVGVNIVNQLIEHVNKTSRFNPNNPRWWPLD